MKHIHATHRGLISISGPDRVSFLQGLVTNDVAKVTANRGLYAALLSPQGKFQYDLFLTEVDDSLWVECEDVRKDDLIKRLLMFKLRSDISIAPLEDIPVVLMLGETNILPQHMGEVVRHNNSVALKDPRHNELGWRIYGEPFMSSKHDDEHSIEKRRLSLGIPDGTKDLIVDKSIPLECGFHELHAIDWSKGCYMGQELTARTYYRGLVRKRLFPVKQFSSKEIRYISGENNNVFAGEEEVGRLCSRCDDFAIAYLRSEVVVNQIPLHCGNVEIFPHIPSWMQLEPHP